MKEKIRQVVDSQDTLAGRTFDLLIIILIVASLITFSIGTIPNLPEQTQRALWIFEAFTVIVFTVEYLLRVYVAENRIGFIFSISGMIDLFAILPFYLPTSVDLRTLRIVRLLRVIRMFKLIRYNTALQRFVTASSMIKEELILFLFATIFVLYLSAVGIYYFENPAQPDIFQSHFHSLWWAVATLTTVGYGDVYPVTAGGRIFTFLVLLIGLGVVAVPAGLFASALTQCLRDEPEQETEL